MKYSTTEFDLNNHITAPPLSPTSDKLVIITLEIGETTSTESGDIAVDDQSKSKILMLFDDCSGFGSMYWMIVVTL